MWALLLTVLLSAAVKVPAQVTGVSLAKEVITGAPALRVTWDSPKSDVTITRYEVQYHTGSQWRRAADVTGSPLPTTTDLEGLQAGTLYSVQVRAVSDIGDEDWSNTAMETTYNTAPTPTSVNAEAVERLGVIKVSWTAPNESDGELPITGYSIRYKERGDNPFMYLNGITETMAEVTGLNASIKYRVYVASVNELDTRVYCCEERNDRVFVTTFNVPAQVTGVSLSKGARSGAPALGVSWDSPKSDAAITRYEVQYRRRSGSPWRSVPSITGSPPPTNTHLERLQAGTSYHVQVRAVSAIGDGGWSDAAMETTYNVPVQVNSVALLLWVRSGAPALRVTWASPKSDVAITRYEVQYRTGSQWMSAADVTGSPLPTTTHLEGLQAGTLYSVQVRAVSDIGDGDWSNAAMQTTYSVPAKVAGLSLSLTIKSGAQVLRVTWDSPQSDLTITRYEVQYNTGSEWMSVADVTGSPPPTATDLEGLQAGTSYSVRVRAVSDVGDGSWSDVGTMTTYRATARPVVRLANSTLHSLSLTWEVVSTADVTSFTVRWSPVPHGPSGSHTLGSDSFQFTVPELVSNIGYTIRVEAAGPLGKMNSSAVTFYTAPRAPSLIGIAMLPEQALRVSWQPATDVKDHSLVEVETQFGKRSQIATANSTVSVLSISGLPKYATGVVTVVSKNPTATSQATTVSIRTITIDTNVTAFSAQWIDGSFTAMQLSWEPVTVADGVAVVYTVSYSPVVNASGGAIDSAGTMQKQTTSSTVTVSGLNPTTWYYFRVEIEENVAAGGSSSTDSGVGIGVAVALVVIIGLAVGLLLCCCFLRYKRQSKEVKTYEPETEMHHVDYKSDAVKTDERESVQPSPDGQASIHIQPSPEPEYATIHSGTISTTAFPAHVQEMHKHRNKGFEKEFQNLQDDPNGSTTMAKLSTNLNKNRYLNIHTFDHSRVVLSVPDESGSDYINASYIDGYMQKNAYIAAQGPKPETVSDFWQMVIDHKPLVLVMLTKVNENGKTKCEQYWNDKLDEPYDAGRNITVTTTGYRTLADYEVRDLTVQCSTDSPHKLTHFQYTAWPDHGVPLHPSSLVKFVQDVQKVHNKSQAPMVVNCSAGVGRTGTFITLDVMMKRLKERGDLNIFDFVTEMRTRRTQMVQAPDQYVFIHDALNDYLTCGDTSVPAHELRRTMSALAGRDGEGRSGFERQFEFLGTLSKVPVKEDFAFANTAAVQKKNRYQDKIPYSNCYLHLSTKARQKQMDYINATFVDSYSRCRAFVAAQSPLEATRTDVWELIWQLKVKTVVLLCPLKEGQKEMCSKFWPKEHDSPAVYPPLLVHRVGSTQEPDWDEIQLEVLGKHKSAKHAREVTLFHFHSWKAEGHPSVTSLLKIMGEVKKKQDAKIPTMVMCDDGMSRSGVFITCMSEIERVKVEGALDVFQTVKAARTQRPYMVASHDQYKLCFEVLQSHLDSFDTYANFKAV